MSARYKEGDIVMLVCNDIEEATYSEFGFNDYMVSMLGSVRAIGRRRYSGVFDAWVYYVEGSHWMWREDWLIPAMGRVDRY